MNSNDGTPRYLNFLFTKSLYAFFVHQCWLPWIVIVVGSVTLSRGPFRLPLTRKGSSLVINTGLGRIPHRQKKGRQHWGRGLAELDDVGHRPSTGTQLLIKHLHVLHRLLVVRRSGGLHSLHGLHHFWEKCIKKGEALRSSS